MPLQELAAKSQRVLHTVTTTTLRVHVPNSGIPGPYSTSYIGTSGPKYIVVRYIDPLNPEPSSFW